MRRVHAEDEAILDCSPARAWHALTDFASYPRWWPSAVKVRVLRTAPALVGTQFEVRPFGSRGFVCEIGSAIAEVELRLRYVAGIYCGTGVWTLAPHGTGTRISYRIDLEIADRLIALLSYVLNVAALHSRLMRRVYRGLADHIADDAGQGPRDVRGRVPE